MLLLDARGRVSFANLAALRLAPCEIGLPLAQWRGVLGEPALHWLQQALTGPGAARETPPEAQGRDGRAFPLAFEPVGPGLFALRLQLPAAEADAAAPLSVSPGHAAIAERVRAFWDSPFPTYLQDASFRLLDANPAFVEFATFQFSFSPQQTTQPARDSPAFL